MDFDAWFLNWGNCGAIVQWQNDIYLLCELDMVYRWTWIRILWIVCACYAFVYRINVIENVILSKSEVNYFHAKHYMYIRTIHHTMYESIHLLLVCCLPLFRVEIWMLTMQSVYSTNTRYIYPYSAVHIHINMHIDNKHLSPLAFSGIFYVVRFTLNAFDFLFIFLTLVVFHSSSDSLEKYLIYKRFSFIKITSYVSTIMSCTQYDA